MLVGDTRRLQLARARRFDPVRPPLEAWLAEARGDLRAQAVQATPPARASRTCRAGESVIESAHVAIRSISEVFGGRAKAGDALEVAGWVRTRRDSKAGLSFVHLSDGSCFDALQLVVPSSL